MGLLVDETSRSDGYHFADGPLERSPAPFARPSSLRIILGCIALVAVIAWAYWR